MSDRLVQFVVERVCHQAAKYQVDIAEPFPIWVIWPPVPNEAAWCTSKWKYYLKSLEHGNEIRARFNVPPSCIPLTVCEHMGKVIE